jgi:3-oxoacyl-[acyl-carrier protein] reductase
MEIQGKRAIVTGGGAGFGLATMECLLKKGGRVAIFDCDVNKVQDVRAKYPEVLALECDVSDVQQVDESVRQVFERFEGLEILVNNAGIMKNAPLINMLNRDDRRHSVDLWHRVIQVNQDAVFFMTRAVVDNMIERRNKGVIVNISSISASGNAGQTAYSASKAAVEAMTKVWAKELGRVGIRSVAVAPGFIDTEGTSEAIEEKMLEQWVTRTPLRRTGTIQEIVNAICFVVENEFLNGVVLAVNGGLNI